MKTTQEQRAKWRTGNFYQELTAYAYVLLDDLDTTLAELETAKARAESCSNMFQVTRRRVCRALGVEEGKSWSWIEDELPALRAEVEKERARADKAERERVLAMKLVHETDDKCSSLRASVTRLQGERNAADESCRTMQERLARTVNGAAAMREALTVIVNREPYSPGEASMQEIALSALSPAGAERSEQRSGDPWEAKCIHNEIVATCSDCESKCRAYGFCRCLNGESCEPAPHSEGAGDEAERAASAWLMKDDEAVPHVQSLASLIRATRLAAIEECAQAAIDSAVVASEDEMCAMVAENIRALAEKAPGAK